MLGGVCHTFENQSLVSVSGKDRLKLDLIREGL